MELSLFHCGRQNNDPYKDVYVLIPRIFKYVTLYGKRNLRQETIIILVIQVSPV
jgi:hypothetical protein